jgi:hypothetical protein
MRIEGSASVPLPPDVVWQGLQDPAVLRASTPGLTRLEETAKDRFEATLELKLPAMTGRFEGRVGILEREPPARMKLALDGQGAPGFVRGTAELRLAPAAGGTELRYVADVDVGGQILRLGQRMISGVAKEMAGQFFETFTKVAAPGAAPAAGATSPSALRAFFSLVWRLIRRALGLARD